MKNLISIENLDLTRDKIVYFYKTEINYHQKFLKMMECLEKEFGIEISTVNIDCDTHVPKRFDFVSLPCLLYYKNKKLFKKHEGMISYKELKKLFRLK